MDNKEITCIIPGFKNVKQVGDNLSALDEKPFTVAEKQELQGFYHDNVQDYIRGHY